MVGSDASVAMARVRIRLSNAEEAQRVREALAPENEGHLETELDGETLVLRAEADTVMGLLRTVDDAMGCVRATGVA